MMILIVHRIWAVMVRQGLDDVMLITVKWWTSALLLNSKLHILVVERAKRKSLDMFCSCLKHDMLSLVYNSACPYIDLCIPVKSAFSIYRHRTNPTKSGTTMFEWLCHKNQIWAQLWGFLFDSVVFWFVLCGFFPHTQQVVNGVNVRHCIKSNSVIHYFVLLLPWNWFITAYTKLWWHSSVKDGIKHFNKTQRTSSSVQNMNSWRFGHLFSRFFPITSGLCCFELVLFSSHFFPSKVLECCVLSHGTKDLYLLLHANNFAHFL